MPQIELHGRRSVVAYATVDADDYWRLSQDRWYLHRRDGYAMRRSSSGHTGYMHRVVLGAGPGQLVDHCDGDGLNNTRSNLRFCTKAQNAWNSASPANVTGMRGVYFDAPNGRWTARIRMNGQRICLGSFRSAEEAGLAYERAARGLRGEFVNLEMRLGVG